MEPGIWRYYKGFYKVYTEDYETVKKIASWEGCRRSNTYYNRYGQVFGWDLIFPSRLYNAVAQAAWLSPRKKNPNRIKQGQVMASVNLKHQFKG